MAAVLLSNYGVYVAMEKGSKSRANSRAESTRLRWGSTATSPERTSFFQSDGFSLELPLTEDSDIQSVGES